MKTKNGTQAEFATINLNYHLWTDEPESWLKWTRNFSTLVLFRVSELVSRVKNANTVVDPLLHLLRCLCSVESLNSPTMACELMLSLHLINGSDYLYTTLTWPYTAREIDPRYSKMFFKYTNKPLTRVLSTEVVNLAFSPN